MISTTSLIIFGIVAIVAVAVIWKWWKKPDAAKKNEEPVEEVQQSLKAITVDTGGPPPPMVFAVNDGGMLDLTDMEGRILNSSYGSSPKVYINLLDMAEKDTQKVENEGGTSFVSTVGNTKLYEVHSRPYIINYTRL